MVCLLDFFCSAGKNIPDQEDLAMVLHLACSEVKSAGVENVVVIARITLGAIVEKRKSPALLPDFVLQRFGFAPSEDASNHLEKALLTQIEECSWEHLRDHHYQIKACAIDFDKDINHMNRARPVSIIDRKSLFEWDGMSLQWVHALQERISLRQSQLLKEMQRSRDKSGHKTMVCHFQKCKGTVIQGGKLVRHLEEVHGLSQEDAKNW